MFARTLVLGRLLFGEAGRALARHRVRSALAALGICIGIAAVVAVVAVGQAALARNEARLEALGDNLVWVEAGSRTRNGVRTGSHGMNTLTLEDAQAILREVPLIKSVSPNVDGTALVIHGDRNWTTHYRGVSPEYFQIKNWPVARGAPFTDAQVLHVANVCVLGESLARQLFGNQDPIGQTVQLGTQLFEVLGVLSRKGQSGGGHDRDDTVILPYTTALSKIRGHGFTWLDDILCSARSPEAVGPAAARIAALLHQRHRIAPDAGNDFNLRRPDEIIKAKIASSRTLQALLIALAAIALLVGGIGIMNVMLVSVTQRTREIGLRLAVGATELDVLMQFLGEAMALGLLGGLGGVLLGIGGTYALSTWLSWTLVIPPLVLAVAPAASIGVGLFFGLYPAWRAARLDPIEALRRE